MDYNPLDEKPKIHFDGSDWAILIMCVMGVLYMIVQVLRAGFAL